MTPEQKKHKAKADELDIKGKMMIDAVKHGISPKAAAILKEQNLERDKAGLIDGGYTEGKKLID